MNDNPIHKMSRCARLVFAALLTCVVGNVSYAAAEGTRYYVNDHLATTVGIADAAGEIAALEADAFGSPLTGGANSGRFTGKPYDEDLGAYVFPFRNYRADEARWMSADPSGFPDGVNQRVAPTYSNNELDPLGLYTLNSSTTLKALGDIQAPYLGFHDFSVSGPGTATWTVQQSSGGCYYAEINTGFKYTVSTAITLPIVGSSRGGGTITAGAQTDIRTHEAWHRTHLVSYADAVLKALEDWSGSYASNHFRTSADANNAARTDLQNAVNVVGQYWQKYLVDRNINHATSTGSINNGNWAISNADWGQSANNTINTYSPVFIKMSGNCE
jgi:RHS repeat-associated protein